MKITVELEVVECMVKDETTGCASGHMHMCLASDATITKDGVKLGTINVDPGMTLILNINGKNYHTSSLAVWEAVYEEVK